MIGEALSYVAVGRLSLAVPAIPMEVDHDPRHGTSTDPCSHLEATLAAIFKLCKADHETSRQVRFC